MPIKIAEIIADVQAIRTKIQAAITAGEHVFKISFGTLNTGQLPNASSALQTVVTNLAGHADLVNTSAAQAVIDALQQKIAAAKTLGQDPAPFELELQALLKPKAPAPAPAATAPAAPTAPKTPTPPAPASAKETPAPTASVK